MKKINGESVDKKNVIVLSKKCVVSEDKQLSKTMKAAIEFFSSSAHGSHNQHHSS